MNARCDFNCLSIIEYLFFLYLMNHLLNFRPFLYLPVVFIQTWAIIKALGIPK
jgi:hypothetical protein